jgi:hypothetical protein
VADRTDRAAPVGRGAILSVPSHRGRIAAALVLCATGLAFALASLSLDFGSLGLPGPGFFPFVLGMLLAGFSAFIAVGAMRDPGGSEERVALGPRDVIIAMLALAGVAIGFEPLGAFLTLGAFAALLLVSIGRVRLPPAALAAVLAMVAVWYFFKILLGLQLPDGPLDLAALPRLLTGRTGP